MSFVKIRSAFIPIFTVVVILIASAGVIAFGRGYRLDFKKNSLKPTGLISTTSDPIGAQVFVDNKLKTATNNSFSIDPGWYTVKIVKEGFIPWEKRIRVQGEVAIRTDAFLFPTNPSLSPLTTTGVANPVLSPDGTKIAYTVPFPKDYDSLGLKKTGLWVYTLSEGPLGRNRDPQKLDTSSATFDFSVAKIVWSPDSRQVLIIWSSSARLYDVGKSNSFTDVSGLVESTLAAWQDDNASKEHQALSAFPQPIIDVATSSAKILNFSPDESKILYEATAAATIPLIKDPPLIGTNSTSEDRNIATGKFYIYDSREDKNYFVEDVNKIVRHEAVLPLFWFPTNRHIILAQNGKVDIMEYDRTNWVTVYAGPFVDSFVAPWPSGSRIVILTNLNPGPSALPNLYTVNLR